MAREINTHKRDDFFAATPPLEALNIILSMTSSCNNGEVVMINDISRAFFHAKAKREVHVQLPNEDATPSKEPMCGKLNYSMYGTRGAAQNWHEEYSQKLVDIGFEQGLATPCTFYHRSRAIRTYVHGDDYVSTGIPNQLKWLREQLEAKYQVKTQLFGPGTDQMKEVKILNRIIQWHGSEGIKYEADPRHIEITVEQLKLKDAKPVSSPGIKEEGRTQPDSEDKLDEKETSQYRAIVASCNSIAPDRPDIAYAVKEFARHMASPTRGDWQRLKRFGRYLVGKPRLQQVYQWQNEQALLKVYSDADWAGCKESRKSTTGGCIQIGQHTIKGWSKTQSLVGLSSGESELYAAFKAAAEGLGMLAMLSDIGWQMMREVWGDASAALGIIHRRGLGKTRHLDIGHLWIQEVAARDKLKFKKIFGKENPADLSTKYFDEKTNQHHVGKLAYRFNSGRAQEAPKLHTLSRSTCEYHEGGHDNECEWIEAILQAINTRNERRDKALGWKCHGRHQVVQAVRDRCGQYILSKGQSSSNNIIISTTVERSKQPWRVRCKTPARGALLLLSVGDKGDS